jgi:dienelactone hydrolase
MTTTDPLSVLTCYRRLASRLRPLQTWDGQPFAAWRRGMVRTLAGITGFKRIAAQPRVELRVRRLWRSEVPEGTIEKIRFACEPGCDATAFVCVPRGVRGPMPWLVCLQGHSTGMHLSVRVDYADHGKPAQVVGDRDFAYGCMRNGVAALCVEQRGFGERRPTGSAKHTDDHDAAMRSLMLGRTIIGERVYDVDRALDYLWTRTDVDRRRVGVMGHSAGGTTSIFAAALLPRLRFAMPSCALCSFSHWVTILPHCACNAVPGLMLEAEISDILGCLAPKPVVVVAGTTDPIFPIAGSRKAFAHLRRIYATAGAADRVRLVIGPGGHDFYADRAWAAARPLLGLG